MSRSKQTIRVVREMTLTVDVAESGIVTLELTGGEVNAELSAGDHLDLVLRPFQPSESQGKPKTRPTYSTSRVPTTASSWGVAAAMAKEEERE